jgi:uncharacterized protein
MSSGLLALLDDIVSLAQVAAASLDDAATQAVQAGTKTAGIVVDDTAVTPRYVVGFSADRELPIIAKIAKGSLKNKLLYLLPAALALTLFAPWAVTPLLMLGGVYLCFEGYEKIHDWFSGHESAHHGPASSSSAAAIDPQALEDEKVAGAIKTDFILSAEIMAIALASITAPDIFTQAVVLIAVALLVTGGVYGAVALIVKADDAGVSLAQNERPASSLFGILRTTTDATVRKPGALDRALAPITKALGRGLVYGMPPFLKVLSTIGTLAMLWVGGGIIIHGLAQMGIHGPEHVVHAIGNTLGSYLPVFGGAVTWFAEAKSSAIFGVAIGAVAALLWGLVQPLFKRNPGQTHGT